MDERIESGGGVLGRARPGAAGQVQRAELAVGGTRLAQQPQVFLQAHHSPRAPFRRHRKYREERTQLTQTHGT